MATLADSLRDVRRQFSEHQHARPWRICVWSKHGSEDHRIFDGANLWRAKFPGGDEQGLSELPARRAGELLAKYHGECRRRIPASVLNEVEPVRRWLMALPYILNLEWHKETGWIENPTPEPGDQMEAVVENVFAQSAQAIDELLSTLEPTAPKYQAIEPLDRVIVLLTCGAARDEVSRERWRLWQERIEAGERPNPPDTDYAPLRNAAALVMEHLAWNATALEQSSNDERQEHVADDLPENTIRWRTNPFFHTTEHLAKGDPRRTGMFKLPPKPFDGSVKIPTLTPSTSELGIIRRHYPEADLSRPPWQQIKATLLLAGVSPETIHQVTSRDLVLMLDRVTAKSEPGRGASKQPALIPVDLTKLADELCDFLDAAKDWPVEQDCDDGDLILAGATLYWRALNVAFDRVSACMPVDPDMADCDVATRLHLQHLNNFISMLREMYPLNAMPVLHPLDNRWVQHANAIFVKFADYMPNRPEYCNPNELGEAGKGNAKSKPLTDEQQRVFEYIRDNGPVTGKPIAVALGIDQATLTRHHIPALKPHGVRNNRDGRGYYLEA